LFFPIQLKTSISNNCFHRFISGFPGRPIKSDVWPGLENTRTYLFGYVKEWYHDKGYGILIDENERDWDNQCEYYVHWSNILGFNTPWLEKGAPVYFEAVEEDEMNKYHMNIPRSHLYDFMRPKFSSEISNQVRAINVQQLDRINWIKEIEKQEEKVDTDITNEKNITDIHVKKTERIPPIDESISDSVKRTVEIRTKVQNTANVLPQKRKKNPHQRIPNKII